MQLLMKKQLLNPKEMKPFKFVAIKLHLKKKPLDRLDDILKITASTLEPYLFKLKDYF